MSQLTTAEQKILKVLVQVGFMVFITAILTTLKLTGVITWSWWLVFVPMLYLAAIVIFFTLSITTAVCLIRIRP